MDIHEAIETLKANYPDACYEQLREAVDMAISALQAQDSKTRKICNTCKHDPPSKKWPCVDCDMRNPADRWEPKDVPDTNAGDMVSRRAAIDALMDEFKRVPTTAIRAKNRIDRLPSAQPEPSTEIQEILNYLDTTLHPIVSPDNWDVYAELHDMVSMLPSAHPEQRWIPVTERLPKEYGNYLISIHGEDEPDIGTINPNDKRGWSLCDANGFYWASDKKLIVTAWMPLPEPYAERRTDETD